MTTISSSQSPPLADIYSSFSAVSSPYASCHSNLKRGLPAKHFFALCVLSESVVHSIFLLAAGTAHSLRKRAQVHGFSPVTKTFFYGCHYPIFGVTPSTTVQNGQHSPGIDSSPGISPLRNTNLFSTSHLLSRVRGNLPRIVVCALIFREALDLKASFHISKIPIKAPRGSLTAHFLHQLL